MVYYPQHCAITTRSQNACVGLAANLPATDPQIMGALVVAVPNKIKWSITILTAEVVFGLNMVSVDSSVVFRPDCCNSIRMFEMALPWHLSATIHLGKMNYLSQATIFRVGSGVACDWRMCWHVTWAWLWRRSDWSADRWMILLFVQWYSTSCRERQAKFSSRT